ncbi:Transmembrane FAM155A protein [Solea senegalensis]|uniref:Transmembrane FAM155A protein n=2 Tax=Solea senegalensis TaxID=28829 RepID=A0AAV6R9T1_SOLSE|nr:Transmembrane FAM155A protein [Solea senegalensis]
MSREVFNKHQRRHEMTVIASSILVECDVFCLMREKPAFCPCVSLSPRAVSFRMVYKPWLCSQYFQTTQMHCSKRIPCSQYCLEVQQRCPFVLPDNDDLIHGGSPSFICTGLLEDHPSGVDPEAECCDVRWDVKVDNRSWGTLKRTHPPCQHRTSLSSSAACRLCNSRLKLCLLVLVLLHTVASLTASHNATGLGLPAITPLEEGPANEE